MWIENVSQQEERHSFELGTSSAASKIQQQQQLPYRNDMLPSIRRKQEKGQRPAVDVLNIDFVHLTVRLSTDVLRRQTLPYRSINAPKMRRDLRSAADYELIECKEYSFRTQSFQ